MSQENVDLVRRVYEAVGRRDSAAVLSFYDPDIEWDVTRHGWGRLLGVTTVIHGHEGLSRFFLDYYDSWERYEDHVEELIDAGDHVIAVITNRARGRVSGLEVESPHNAGVFTIREGKIVRAVWFPSRDEALEAVGRTG